MTYSRSTFILALSIVMASEASSAAAQLKVHQLSPYPMNEVMAGRVMLKVKGADLHNGKPAQPAADQLSRLSTKLGGGRFVSGMSHGGWTIWEIPTSKNPREAAAAVKDDPDVVWAEPLNRLYKVTLPVPNDPDWAYIETSSTYVFGGSGSGSGSGTGTGTNTTTSTRSHGTKGFRRLWNLWDINAVTDDSGGVVSGGWSVFPGQWYTSSNKPTDCPIIAFVDTGCDLDHPDFINAGGTGTDVSLGGQIMKSMSALFENGVVVPGGIPTDLDGHGTHVTGIAIAGGNNGGFDNDGMIGIGYNSRGMILRVFDDQGNSTDADAAAAMYYAADNGAAIISISLGTTNYSQVFQDAVTYCFQKGSLVVASGNENGSSNGNADLGPIYPAACSGALGVTANAPGLYPADDYYAGYGNYVGIAAPGGDLVQTGLSSYFIQYVFSTATRYPCTLSEDTSAIPPYTLDYTYLVGTSMACPHVSGAAGLYYGQNGMHQTDGFANLKAFQALQVSALGTGGALLGGWEQTQGYGSLDIQGLMQLGATPNPRSATVGDVTGIVYYGGTPTPNTTVTATSIVAPFTSYNTTTFADGTYRFDPFPAGIYDIKASPLGATKTKRVQVNNGCDMPGVDFFAGPKVVDTTPPVIAKFSLLSGTKNSLNFEQWAYDTETEIDTATVQIGTAPGSANILAPQLILPGTLAVNLTGLKLPEYYYASFVYTNGIGLTSTGIRASEPNWMDAFVSDATPKTDHLLSYLDVKTGSAGSNDIAYISINLSTVGATVGDAELTLKGEAKGTAVPVGVYATSNAQWDEVGLTWNNAPTISGSAVDEQTVGANGTYTWNIGSLIQAAKTAGRNSVTIAVKCDTLSATGATFGSRRSKSEAPIVQVTSHN